MPESFMSSTRRKGELLMARSGLSRSGLTRSTLFKGAALTGAAVLGKTYFNGASYKGTPDLNGKIVVITGGNTGIGKETAEQLAKFNAKVIIACRNPEKAQRAIQTMKSSNSETSKLDITSVILDLESMDSINQCAAE